MTNEKLRVLEGFLGISGASGLDVDHVDEELGEKTDGVSVLWGLSLR
jgi:hypothetical protein